LDEPIGRFIQRFSNVSTQRNEVDHLEASLHLSQVELRSIPELRSASTLLSERQARAKQLVIKKQIKSPMSHPKATICLFWVETTTLFKASKSR
jgi:hypothetical protein